MPQEKNAEEKEKEKEEENLQWPKAIENAATLAQLKSSSAEERPPHSAGESKLDRSLHLVADMLY